MSEKGGCNHKINQAITPVSFCPTQNAAIFSSGITRIPHFEEYIPEYNVIFTDQQLRQTKYDVVIGWGHKETARYARVLASNKNLPYIALEDGFLRSVGLGNNDPPLSIVVDDLGIYYDATVPSRLEALLQDGGWESSELFERASRAMAVIVREKLSKYNRAPLLVHRLPGLNEKKVLLIDQTCGDSSITYGLADAGTFDRMLSAALVENPYADIIIKTHPDVVIGKKCGYLSRLRIRHPRVHILADDFNPLSVIEQAERVYTVTSQMGFEALLLRKPVECFGLPFYAGWGLTRDRQVCPRRTRQRTLVELFAVAYLLYPRYLDPETGQRCEAERLIDWLALQRRMRDRLPSTIYALGFSRWKRQIVRDFCQGSTVRFVRNSKQVPPNGTLAVWGSKPIRSNLSDGVTLLRFEDGFLRSVGLGADLVRPLSWVMDRRGIYYDATAPSDLENILLESEFDEKILERAGALRAAICKVGLTKYNVGVPGWDRPHCVDRVILVPGQVESDASIRYGESRIRTNIDLLKAVRAANPDSYLVYKPHPDVVTGLRAKGRGEEGATSCCDELVTDVAMGDLLAVVDEVHTLTSLAGFEALLRGKRVVTYGQPFYAGWGLTTDQLPVARRIRTLSLDELVASVLIEYPMYVSLKTRRFTTPERALSELVAWRDEGPAMLPLWRKVWRLLARLRGKL